jgi:hypothetical protein
MSWKKERDELIAQTMAFVQSVTGKREETSGLNGGFASAPVAELPDLPELDRSLRPAPKPAASLEPVRIAEVPRAAAPAAPRPITPSDMASEIRARVASFRAHQERFNREREQYFSATLERLRAAIKDANPPPLFDE